MDVNQTPSTDGSLSRRRAAVWPAAEACFVTGAGLVWQVEGGKGPGVIRPEGSTQMAGWRAAVEQAAATLRPPS